MKINHARTLLSALLPLALVACGGAEKKTDDMAGMEGMEKGEGAEKKADKDAVTLTARQIADAGIEVARPTVGGVAGAIELPALVQAIRKASRSSPRPSAVAWSRSHATSASPSGRVTRWR